jgi:hypothetical protein
MRKLQVLLLSLILLTVGGFAKGRSSAPRRSTSKSTVTKKSSAPQSTGTTVHKRRSDVTVHGYTTKNGKQVQSYKRTAPNGTQKDNFSTKGNVNPYTGKKGTKTPKK